MNSCDFLCCVNTLPFGTESTVLFYLLLYAHYFYLSLVWLFYLFAFQESKENIARRNHCVLHVYNTLLHF